MSDTWNNDRWRDSYDDWKLATPPEYEEEQSEESKVEEDCWRDGYSRDETRQIMADWRRAREAEAKADADEPDQPTVPEKERTGGNT